MHSSCQFCRRGVSSLASARDVGAAVTVSEHSSSAAADGDKRPRARAWHGAPGLRANKTFKKLGVIPRPPPPRAAGHMRASSRQASALKPSSPAQVHVIGAHTSWHNQPPTHAAHVHPQRSTQRKQGRRTKSPVLAHARRAPLTRGMCMAAAGACCRSMSLHQHDACSNTPKKCCLPCHRPQWRAAAASAAAAAAAAPSLTPTRWCWVACW
jgi:hypothetical protein